MSDAHHDEIAKLEALYADNPGGRLFTHLAEACRKAGDLERAREVLTEGIEQHPDYSSAHVVLGRVLMDQGEPDQARAEFQRVLELDSQNLVALRSLGDIARAEGHTEEALERYHQLLDLEPSDSEARGLIDELTEGLVVPGPQEDVDLAPDTADAAMDLPGETDWAVAEESAAPEPETDDEPVWEAVPEAPVEDVSAEDVSAETEPAEEAAYVEEPAWEEASADEAVWDEPGPEEPAMEEPESGEAWSEAGDLESEEWSTEAPMVEEEPWDEAGTSAGMDEVGETQAADAGAGMEDVDVMTETIAQVYARQGLYDRAAEVYRELVRTRPDDDGLQDRLAEMEAKAAESTGAGAAAGMEGLQTEEDTAPGIEVEEADSLAAEDPGTVEGFQTVEFDAEEEEPEVAALAGLETEEAGPGMTDTDGGIEAPEPEFEEPEFEEPEPEFEEPAAATEIAKSAESPEPWGAPEPEPEPEPDPWAEDVDEGAAEAEGDREEPATEAAPWEVAPVTAGEADEALAAEEELETEEALEGAEAPEAEEEPESPWTGEDWSEKEAETPYTWAEAEESDDASPPIRTYLKGVLEWGGGEAAPAAPEAGESAGEKGGASGSEHDDDDQDMFRSWLESLKQ